MRRRAAKGLRNLEGFCSLQLWPRILLVIPRPGAAAGTSRPPAFTRKPMTEQTRLDALLVRYEELRAQDTPVSPEELCQDCPELAADLKRQIQMLESMNALLRGADSATDALASTGPDAVHPGPSSSGPPEALCTGARYQVLHF